MELAQLQPLLDVPGTSFTSLQLGEAAGQAKGNAKLTDFTGDLHDFHDTAALVANLDLVISVDTAVAHLAGALGKPCWVMLPARGTDWRWLRERSDSPWYPATMRLYRQAQAGDWRPLVEQIAADLESFAQTQR
jgi:ADP-heptose:LPS heptosyltransferase